MGSRAGQSRPAWAFHDDYLAWTRGAAALWCMCNQNFSTWLVAVWKQGSHWQLGLFNASEMLAITNDEWHMLEQEAGHPRNC